MLNTVWFSRGGGVMKCFIVLALDHNTSSTFDKVTNQKRNTLREMHEIMYWFPFKCIFFGVYIPQSSEKFTTIPYNFIPIKWRLKHCQFETNRWWFQLPNTGWGGAGEDAADHSDQCLQEMTGFVPGGRSKRPPIPPRQANVIFWA